MLKSNAKSKDIDDSETFTVNTAFDSKMFKLKVPLISLKSAIESRGGSGGGAAGAGDKETGDVPEQVEEVRMLPTLKRRACIRAAVGGAVCGRVCDYIIFREGEDDALLL